MVKQELEVNWRRFSPWTKSQPPPPGKVRKEEPRNKLVGLPVSRGSIKPSSSGRSGKTQSRFLAPLVKTPNVPLWPGRLTGRERRRKGQVRP